MKKTTLLFSGIAALSLMAMLTKETKAIPAAAEVSVGGTIYSDADGSNGRDTSGGSFDLSYTITSKDETSGTLKLLYVHSTNAEITLPESVSYCGKTFVITEMKENGSYMDTYGFVSNTTVQKLTLPSKLEKIGGNSFANATSLESLNIPETVTSIGSAAFYGCDALKTITFNSLVPPTIAANTFTRTREDLKIIVPCSVLSDYKNAANWSDFSSKIYAAPHVYDTNISYVWNGDQCTASTMCINDGCDDLKDETVKGVYVKDTDATIDSDEKGHYEATFQNELFSKQVTAVNGVVKEGTKLPNPESPSAGAIVGITVGSVVGACLIAYVAMFFVWKKNEKALKFLTPSFKWISSKIFKE